MPRKEPGSRPQGRARRDAQARAPERPPGRRGTGARAVAAVRRWVVTAPGTYLWLGVLFATTVVARQMSPGFEEEFLRDRSTNLHELSRNPVRVLISSALWIDGGRWLPYAVLFTLFHATAEHWLGTRRWLAVTALAHVLATLVSEGALAWAIRYGHAPPSAADTLDVGVSYGLAGVIAVLTYRVPRLWRYAYAFAVLVVYGVPLLGDGRTFTDLGHFTAVLIGLACYPLTRRRTARETKRPAAQ
ncbi:rhomboid-like protein [Streptomyces sp. NPDC049916]|uniref:rhomboid-like protein n=1 Tax=Streptomyces sp. NPDC049916 TaxID=3155156 RepID=UPI0034207F64